MKITKNKKIVIESVETSAKTGTVDELLNEVSAKLKGMHKSRMRVSVERPTGNIVLQRGQALSEYGLDNGDVLVLKDLGPQIDWTTVFVLEYFGPIVIHAVFYAFPWLFYEQWDTPKTRTQTIVAVLWILHHVKREIETVFVHRFSNDTMPLVNLPKNCMHYWVLGGVMVAYPMYSPLNRGGIQSGWLQAVVVGVWVYAQVSNAACHWTLRQLRPAGTRIRRVPRGYWFELVSCPNYMFEIVGWVSVSVLSGSLYVWIFTLVGALQMYFWALKKHARYQKEFKIPQSRKVLVPFVV